MTPGFDTPTNRGRVQRLLETLDHLDKSARSNRATPQDWAELLEPALSRMQALTAGATLPASPPLPDPAPGVPPVRRGHHKEPLWASVRQMAETAPVEELSGALGVIVDRLETYVLEARRAGVSE